MARTFLARTLFTRHCTLGLLLVVAGSTSFLALTAQSESSTTASATTPATTHAATSPLVLTAQLKPGELIPSDDVTIWDFHSLGLVNGHSNIYRSASPLRDFVKKADIAPDDPAVIAEANVRMKRLHALGIRTLISFENPEPNPNDPEDGGKKSKANWIAAEKAAATAAGITFVSYPLANTGPDSFETISDEAAIKILDPLVTNIFRYAEQGGVLFHCAAGHDRTGITTAYMRIKYQKWSADEAIAEMRRFGHNWPKYSANGGTSSWHEEHIRAIAATLPKGDEKTGVKK